MYSLGLDIGSSSIKAAIVNIETGATVASAQSPKTELAIESPQPGFAEQDPAIWWHHVQQAVAELHTKVSGLKEGVHAIGISYQMHGLVLVDAQLEVLRPAIIWCDSRAVAIGEAAFQALGAEFVLSHYLNSPGNFTASKLKWVKDNQPELYAKVKYAMLPGDYIAMKLSGEVQTTISGLSEGILWDYKAQGLNQSLLAHYGLDATQWPSYGTSFEALSTVNATAADALNLKAGVPISYRAGDQPNNALALQVLEPGQVGANAGTSGVIYGVHDKPVYDPQSRVNTFVHVNHTAQQPRYGVLACVNGTGIMNSWTRKMLSTAGALDYPTMNDLAQQAPAGSDGLHIYPFGNGAERILGNANPGASLTGIDLNRHGASHMLRATQEGIVYALALGIEIMRDMGMACHSVKAGHANMFLSPVFRQVFAAVTQCEVDLYETDGASGAARGAAIGAGLSSQAQAFAGLQSLAQIKPDAALQAQYADLFAAWKAGLKV